MAAIAKLIRNAPRTTLEAFLDAQQPSLAEQLRSFGPHDDYAGPLLKSVDELTDREHAWLTANADRVVGMTDEFGQTALLSVVDDRLLVEELENEHDRSLWVYDAGRSWCQRAPQASTRRADSLPPRQLAPDVRRPRPCCAGRWRHPLPTLTVD